MKKAILFGVFFDMCTWGIRRLAATVIFLTSLWPAGVLAASENGASKPTQLQQNPAASLGIFNIAVEQGGLLSVDVREAPLGEVLRIVGEQAAIRMTVQNVGADQVTLSFTGLNLEEGIRRLAHGRAVVMIWAAQGHGAGSGRLAEVRVYKAGDPGTAEVTTFTPPAMAQGATPPAVENTSTRSSTSSGSTADPGAQKRAELAPTVQDLLPRARQRDPDALGALANMLAQDPDPAVRQDVAAALGGIKDPAVVDALTAALGDQDSTVRTKIVLALGQIGDERLAGPAADLIQNDPDPTVRRTAVWALSRLQNDDAYRLIVGATTDPDVNVRQAAADTIERWGRPLRPTFANRTATN